MREGIVPTESKMVSVEFGIVPMKSGSVPE
jgi:hypothetical protein